MSFSIYPDIRSQPVADAKAALMRQTMPENIKDFLLAGVDGLVAKYGDGVLISITAYGHLCTGEGSSDETNVTAGVRYGGIEAAARQGEEAAKEPAVVTKR